jgi:hypothetical protein
MGGLYEATIRLTAACASVLGPGIHDDTTPGRRHAPQRGIALWGAFCPESTVRAIEPRYLERWEGSAAEASAEAHAGRRDPHENQEKFLTVNLHLQTTEPSCFGRERKRETLDEFLRTNYGRQCKRTEAACVDMWEPFRVSVPHWAPQCQIVDEVPHYSTRQRCHRRSAEGGALSRAPTKRGLMEGKNGKAKNGRC